MDCPDLTPTSDFVDPMLTDFYQLTMAYGYWKARKHEVPAVFDLFFRNNPFKGAFAVFAGVHEVVRLLSAYHFTDEQLAFVRSKMPGADPAFFDWLRTVDASQVRVRSLAEGTLAFARVPLLTVEGPLAICQLIETPLLTLTNYPTLIATNAARFRIAAGPGKSLLEFGLRRAQGPDGGVSASRYAFLGGFDATSNVQASYFFPEIPVSGTHAHSWVQSFTSLAEVRGRTLADTNGEQHDFTAEVVACRQELGFVNTNEDELASFIAYAVAWPNGFLALVDTYDTLKSGVPNFLCVALALHRLGYRPIGVRLDSGDLAFMSRETRRLFRQVSEQQGVDFTQLRIVASNDLNEDVLWALREQGHEIDSFGIGTHLVTAQAQPALGAVYKLVEVGGQPRIKLSQDVIKVTIPSRKEAFRLIGQSGQPLLDLMIQADEPPPRAGSRILCRHPFDETKRAYVTPTEVQRLQQVVWDGCPKVDLRPLVEIRASVLDQLSRLRPDHLRALNPTPYKVSVSEKLYDFIHGLWLEEAPIAEIK
jgi:nicotinate phosphoribosyltransferase